MEFKKKKKSKRKRERKGHSLPVERSRRYMSGYQEKMKEQELTSC
jgi:hypothetical protein